MNKPLHRPSIIVFMACSMVLGLQHLRALQPQLILLMRDRLGWSIYAIAALALALLAVAFLVSPVARLLGNGRALVLCAVLLAGCRLAAQMWRGDPLLDFGFTMGGCVAFFLVVPLLVGCSRPYGPGSSEALAVGWLLGQLADLTLHGIYGTWDAVWRGDGASLGLALGLAVLEVAAAVILVRHWRGVGAMRGDLAPLAAWAWMGFGPWLFLATVQLVNPGRFGALLGVSHRLPWLMLSVALIVSLVILTAMFRHGGSPGILLLVPLVLLLVFLLRSPWPAGAGATAQMLVGTVLASLLGALVLIATSVEEDAGDERGAAGKRRRARRRLARQKRAQKRRAAGRDIASFRRLSLAHGSTMVLFLMLSFANAARFDMAIPFAAGWVFVAAALALGAAAMAAGRALRSAPPPPKRGWRGWLILALAFGIPSTIAAWPAAPRVSSGSSSENLRVATYNLHCGVDTQGDLDLEALAAVLEKQRLDIIVLQEASRGWPINGGVDSIEWLAERLDMYFAFAGTTGPLWGNAVLSRLPIIDEQKGSLPARGLTLGRGFLDVKVAQGDGMLNVVATHLHHKEGDSLVRQKQMRELVALLEGRERTILAGDLNARPDAPEIDLLHNLGWTDAFAVLGSDDGFTNPSIVPRQRIDYIWLSPDLEARSATVVQSEASDHLPVVVEVATPW